MLTKTKVSSVTIPLTALKCLYKSARGQKIVCEINFNALKRINGAETLDTIVAEARLEYFSGKTKSFTNTKSLLAYLNR